MIVKCSFLETAIITLPGFLSVLQDIGTRRCAPAAPSAELSVSKEAVGGIRAPCRLTATVHLQLYVPRLLDPFYIWRGDILVALFVSSTLSSFRPIIAPTNITVSAPSLHMLIIVKTAPKTGWKRQSNCLAAVRRASTLKTASN